MKFKNKLISGRFKKRYKRFFVDVKINSQVITAHCPNTGSMFGLLKENNKVWLSKSNNPTANNADEYILHLDEYFAAKEGSRYFLHFKYHIFMLTTFI